MELQELVARARILFKGAPKRVQVFELVNGIRAAKEIAHKSRRTLSSTLADLQKMKDMGLLVYRKNSAGEKIKKSDSIVYEKDPILKHLSKLYFKDPTKLPIAKKNKISGKNRARSHLIRIPIEQELLDVCKVGEDQLYEFKRAGVDIRELSKEICAFANTQSGGIIFYGVEDDGSIGNADIKKSTFDQKLQNSVRNTISPVISIKIVEKDVLGHKIFIIAIPGRDKEDVYRYEGRVYLRQGTNVFEAKSEEIKKLYKGINIV